MTIASLSYFETQYKRSPLFVFPSCHYFFLKVVVFISCDISRRKLCDRVPGIVSLSFRLLSLLTRRILFLVRACVFVCVVDSHCLELARGGTGSRKRVLKHAEFVTVVRA